MAVGSQLPSGRQGNYIRRELVQQVYLGDQARWNVHAAAAPIPPSHAHAADSAPLNAGKY